MTEPSSPLSDYPGWFPAKLPVWKRKWVQLTGASLLAFTIGMAAAGSPEPTEDMITTAKAQALVDKAAQQAHDQATEAAERDAAKSPAVLALLEQEKAKASQAAAGQAKAELKKAQAQLAKVTRERNRARARATQAEAAAKAAENKVRSLAEAEPEPTADGGGGMDPIFDTCGEANDNGYGPYQQGVDPEYGYYDDRDDDGDVCER